MTDTTETGAAAAPALRNAGADLRAARAALGLTQAAAARAVGVRPGHYCRLESKPSGGQFRKTAGVIAALGLGLEHFFPAPLILESADRLRAKNRRPVSEPAAGEPCP